MSPIDGLKIGVLALLLTGSGAGLASAYDEAGSERRIERNWKEPRATTSGTSRSARADTQGDTRTRRGRDRVHEDRDDEVRDGGERYRGGDTRRWSRHGGGLDADEAARIRQAHRESGGHVVLRRDYDDEDVYDVPSYSSPGYHRRQWWSFWW